MREIVKPAVVLFVLLSVLTGLVYPLLMTAVEQILFPWQAGGSLVSRDGKLVGSHQIGQNFSDPKYFWGRLSATSPMPYNGAGSTGSNLAATNPALVDQAKGRIDALRSADPPFRAAIPADLATASASGLDPDIGPRSALAQVARVAHARGLDEARVGKLVTDHTEEPWLGLIGEPRVNVLELNLALDAIKP